MKACIVVGRCPEKAVPLQHLPGLSVLLGNIELITDPTISGNPGGCVHASAGGYVVGGWCPLGAIPFENIVLAGCCCRDWIALNTSYIGIRVSAGKVASGQAAHHDVVGGIRVANVVQGVAGEGESRTCDNAVASIRGGHPLGAVKLQHIADSRCRGNHIHQVPNAHVVHGGGSPSVLSKWNALKLVGSQVEEPASCIYFHLQKPASCCPVQVGEGA